MQELKIMTTVSLLINTWLIFKCETIEIKIDNLSSKINRINKVY